VLNSLQLYLVLSLIKIVKYSLSRLTLLPVPTSSTRSPAHFGQHLSSTCAVHCPGEPVAGPVHTHCLKCIKAWREKQFKEIACTTAVDDVGKTLGQLKLKSAGNSNYFQFFIAL